MKKIFAFIIKYQFPLHFGVVWQRVEVSLSTFSSTLWMRLFLKTTGCSYGESLRADGVPTIRIQKRGCLTFGDNCLFKSRFKSNLVGGCTPIVLECLGDGSIRFGDNSGCSFAVISSRVGVDIGDHVSIGGNVRIFDHDYHSLNYMDRRDGKKDRAGCRALPVYIGNDVFVGTNSIILKGVKIGDRAIIGAGSVVSCDVPSDEIWAGNPARFIKKQERTCG